ncbi:integrase catalytic domain-containing protein [Trichonephila clavipes]|nr:integrase catalytic domain-containing protein [Trichonephila clavipes]
MSKYDLLNRISTACVCDTKYVAEATGGVSVAESQIPLTTYQHRIDYAPRRIRFASMAKESLTVLKGVAARLSSRVQEIVRKKKECKVFHWTDSKIVLFWIKGSSKRWNQFVANRVQEISELTDPDSWFHCSGQDNPSDFLSRGLSVDTLISNNKWWTGPAFLRTNEQLTQSQKLYYLNSCLSNEVKEFASTFDTFSSLYVALESRYDNKD